MTADVIRREAVRHPGGADCDAKYLALLRTVLADGEDVAPRGAGRRRVTAVAARFSSTPLVGVRRTAWRTALREMEFFLAGGTDLKDMHPSVRPWWEPWAAPDGSLPFSYGEQLRDAGGKCSRTWGVRTVDQVDRLVRGLRDDPHSTRHVVTTWNPAEMTDPACRLPNCWGTVIQGFVCPETNALSLATYQRSADVVCGLPHNWLQIWAFLLWLAARAWLGVGTLTWVGGDVHLYAAHGDLARQVAAAAPVASPGLVYALSGPDFRADDFRLDGPYSPAISERAEVVV